jgi:16S rRNA (cytosine967-C5)-methyltransferase
MAAASKKARVSAPPKSSRAIAADILHAVETRRAFADILLDRALHTNNLSDSDRALATEIVYGTLRWRGRIDWTLGLLTRKPLEDMDVYLRNVLRLTLYQIMFLDRVPAYAAVNEAVELAKRYGGRAAAGLVNAIARSLLRDKERLAKIDIAGDRIRRLAVKWSHPEWLVQNWLNYFGGDEIEDLLKADNEAPPLVVRANRLKIRREELIARFRHDDIDTEAAPHAPQAIRIRGGVSVEKLPGFTVGLFFVQAEASQLVAQLLAPRPGERIWDASAAPGGKATHVAELMDDKGEIVATDISARGIERLRQNIARLGIGSIRPALADAAAELPEDLAAPYDRILADLPCTGLGTLRSHPEAKWLKSDADIRRLGQLQKKILERVSAYLKPGGTLVYSTCTLTRAENEDVVEDFLRGHKDYTLEDAAEFLPAGAEKMTRGKYFMALPHRDDTDGFFAARMRKA